MTLQPFAPAPSLSLQVATPPTGYAFVNGTGPIPGLTWNTPNDGRQHRFQVFGQLIAASAVGGQLNVSFTNPDLSGQSRDLLDSFTTGWYDLFTHGAWIVAPGTAVTLRQQAATTAGTATAWLEIWGS